MKHRKRIFVELALALGLLAPASWGQKPPGPTPSPTPTPSPSPSPSPSPGSVNSGVSNTQPIERDGDFVLFLMGHVSTSDGSPVPHDMMIARVCNEKVRQQIYASPHGDFNMQLGSMADSFLDATADPTSQRSMANKAAGNGIPRHELATCELRATASGFYPGVVHLIELTTFGSSTIDVGGIVVRRAVKPEGMTVSATPYKAPQDARKAYEKGIKAEKRGKPAEARKYFEKATEIYPEYASAWFQLGTLLQKENQKGEARAAYTRATAADTKYMPPYLSLAEMAYEEGKWTEVLKFTGHILDLDPLNRVNVTNYVVDLDPLNYAEAYFYNAMANYKLGKMEAAEKSAVKAEHLDLRTRFPQLHLLMADFFAQKNDYANAISEIQMYLELAPNAKNANQLREQLAELEALNRSETTREKTY